MNSVQPTITAGERAARGQIDYIPPRPQYVTPSTTVSGDDEAHRNEQAQHQSSSDTPSNVGGRHDSAPPTININMTLPTFSTYRNDLKVVRPRGRVVHNLEGTCSICQTDYSNDYFNPKVVKTACDHLFHHSCLGNWHKSSQASRNTCPLCRKKLFRMHTPEPSQPNPDEEAQAVRALLQEMNEADQELGWMREQVEDMPEYLRFRGVGNPDPTSMAEESEGEGMTPLHGSRRSRQPRRPLINPLAGSTSSDLDVDDTEGQDWDTRISPALEGNTRVFFETNPGTIAEQSNEHSPGSSVDNPVLLDEGISEESEDSFAAIQRSRRRNLAQYAPTRPRSRRTISQYEPVSPIYTPQSPFYTPVSPVDLEHHSPPPAPQLAHPSMEAQIQTARSNIMRDYSYVGEFANVEGVTRLGNAPAEYFAVMQMQTNDVCENEVYADAYMMIGKHAIFFRFR